MSAQMQFSDSTLDLQALIDVIPYPVVVKSRAHRIVLLNIHACAFLGHDCNVLLSRSDNDLYPPDQVRGFHEVDDQVFASGGIDEREEQVTDGLGMTRQVITRKQRVVLNGSEYLVAVMSDVTLFREAEARSRYLAFHDMLTGLANRSLLNARIDHISPDRLNRCALLLVSLDNFKAVNERHGQPVGDDVLVQFGQRLSGVVRACDTVARLEGDKFSILLTDIAEGWSIDEICQRVGACGSQAFDAPSGRPTVTASIGAVPLQPTRVATSELHRRADIALYHARDSGRGRWSLYTDELDRRLRHRRVVEADLSDALEAGTGIDVYYQPLVAVASRTVIGFEALARWHHPTCGLVMPDDFISIAEASGLIIKLGETILRKACTDAASWVPPLRLSVNVSPIQFAHDDLVSVIQDALHVSGLDPARLDLEVTEGVLINDTDATLAVLTRIRALGVKIVLDDFGTGYSSLSYLRHFPFDSVKIDKSFITDITTDRDAASIVEAVIALCKSLNIAAVAEGVETAEQFDMLLRLGCPQAQGYLIGRPMPIERFAGVLLNDNEVE